VGQSSSSTAAILATCSAGRPNNTASPRHADVVEVSKHSDVYSSWENTAIIRHKEDIGREAIELQRLILLNIDPPQHTKLRGIVSRGFTPRAIGALREALTARAERIVHTALTEGTGDFVTDVACELPLQAIAELLGIPQEDRGQIFAWSNEMVAYDDLDYEGDGPNAAAELVGYSMVLAEDRRACPRDDIVTKLVNAEVDGWPGTSCRGPSTTWPNCRGTRTGSSTSAACATPTGRAVTG
jgi:cholest-4-en-3-one 26-monooxygenase